MVGVTNRTFWQHFDGFDTDITFSESDIPVEKKPSSASSEMLMVEFRSYIKYLCIFT